MRTGANLFKLPLVQCLAESEGFEPSDRLPGQYISSVSRSTTLATLRTAASIVQLWSLPQTSS